MNQTTKETRRRSYDAVLPKRAARCRLILETLGNRELTASEITEELVAAGRIPYFNRNYVAPRLTELKEIGILTTVGRRKATRSDATEAVWARREEAEPVNKIIINTGITAGDVCPKCLGSGKVKAMQMARCINGPTVRVEDTRVACDLCGGSGRLKGGKHGKE